MQRTLYRDLSEQYSKRTTGTTPGSRYIKILASSAVVNPTSKGSGYYWADRHARCANLPSPRTVSWSAPVVHSHGTSASSRRGPTVLLAQTWLAALLGMVSEATRFQAYTGTLQLVLTSHALRQRKQHAATSSPPLFHAASSCLLLTQPTCGPTHVGGFGMGDPQHQAEPRRYPHGASEPQCLHTAASLGQPHLQHLPLLSPIQLVANQCKTARRERQDGRHGPSDAGRQVMPPARYSIDI
eukprot:766638-Hanusia_phi.AAC.1